MPVMKPPRIKFLTGAPLAQELNYVDEYMLTDWMPQFHTFADVEGIVATQQSTASFSSANWREVPLDGKVFHETPLFPRTKIRPAAPLNPSEEADLYQLQSTANDEHISFLDHSLAVLDDLQGTQLEVTPLHTMNETTYITMTSFSATISLSFSDRDSDIQEPTHQVRVSGPVTDIKAIPKSTYLERLRPQTMTINLIVGIINVPPARTVTTRRGYNMDIVEILVGDETKAGFSITTWLPSLETNKHRQGGKTADETRQHLQRLRTGDVVYVENVALHVYQNQVFGQSLNRRIARNVTRFSVLQPEHMAGEAGQGFSSSIRGKVLRVKDWVDGFIGPSRKRKTDGEAGIQAAKRSKGKARQEEEWLPPDDSMA